MPVRPASRHVVLAVNLPRTARSDRDQYADDHVQAVETCHRVEGGPEEVHLGSDPWWISSRYSKAWTLTNKAPPTIVQESQRTSPFWLLWIA